MVSSLTRPGPGADSIAPREETAKAPDVGTLRSVEQRVLWLAMSAIHHANRIRPNPTGVKAGGHQASCASMSSIMTALWFHSLRSEDRVSVKPHAGPMLHAINYLLGELSEPQLRTLREYGGLQSYPSRTKDPGRVDYSTGSMGLGATAPIWGAMAGRYLRDHFGTDSRGRHISLLGDAELDEGACWEAIREPAVAALGEVLWVVDLNRQSLDRVVPIVEADRLQRMFEAAGWQVITLKYGRRLRELFDQPGGELLRTRIDGMPNAEYQRLLRATTPAELRSRLPDHGYDALEQLIGQLDDHALHHAVRDLGGHDLADLIEAFGDVDATRPTVILAYTIKGRWLPLEGHPANHGTLLTTEQMHQLAVSLNTDPNWPWAGFPASSAEARLCAERGQRLSRPEHMSTDVPSPPIESGRRHTGSSSTQAALGRLLMDLSRTAPELAHRVVTASPDVASTTNLGGWLNKVGVYASAERPDWFADDPETLMHWKDTPHGQHIELGIAEGNLAGLLGELGATWSQWSEPLLPIGVIYDCFVSRALEPWLYGVYAGGQSILVGTPSGVTLAGEGGAHQSVITPSIGVEAPNVVAYEPAFAQDFEWCFLNALAHLGRPGGQSAYFRLTTRPVDQSLARLPNDAEEREGRRQATIAGGYLLRNPGEAQLTVAAAGAVVPDAIAAVNELDRQSVSARLVCVTSADLIFRATQPTATPAAARLLAALFPHEPAMPLLTIHDGHPHTLSFLAGVSGSAAVNLGVSEFGQSGNIHDLYRHHGLDAVSLTSAALDLLET